MNRLGKASFSILLILCLLHAYSVYGHGQHAYKTSDNSTRLATESRRCIHDELQAKYWKHQVKPVVDWQTEATKRGVDLKVKRTANWQPFRIVVSWNNLAGDSGSCYNSGDTVPDYSTGGTYTCTSSDILGSVGTQYLETVILPYAVTRFNQLLSVDRSLQPGLLYVANSTNSGCGGYAGSPTVLMNSTIAQDGIDADFVLLVTARPIPSQSGAALRTLAYATTCQTATNGRPIVGWANFDPSSLTPSDVTTLAEQTGVAIHETTHALGFTAGMFSAAGIVSIDSQGRGRITDPTVVSYLANHFACASLQGGLLEDDGGAGTAGSHWEKSAFMNEYITGTASSNPVVSAATMLTLQALGFYQANLEATDALVFGFGAGCGMSDDWTGCSNWPSSYTCNANTGLLSECTADLAGYGPCVSEPSSGSLIGSGCSYYEASSTCIYPIDPYGSQAQALAGSSIQSYGESFAIDSRCFSTTLNKIASLTSLIPVPAPTASKCYRVHCTSPQEARVGIDNVWYPCYPGGNSIPATSFGGSVTCPANIYQLLCQNVPSDIDWPRITSISPNKAKPGAAVTVTYSGDEENDAMSLIIETNCSPVSQSNGTVTADLAPSSFWSSPRYLNIFGTKLNVIIRDSMNRSDAQYGVFQADIPFGLAYLEALWHWMQSNVLVTVLICLGLAIPIVIAVFCCVRKCCKKKKPKLQQAQYRDNYTLNQDQYYYDDDLDDATRHAPPPYIS